MRILALISKNIHYLIKIKTFEICIIRGSINDSASRII